MLNFLYTGEYGNDTEIPPLQLHAQMYSLADKYQIQSLTPLAIQKYRQILQTAPKLDDYLLSIPVLYAPIASGAELRAIAVKYARRVLGRAIKLDDVRTTLMQIIDQVPEYGFDILEAFVVAPLRGDCSICGPDQEADSLQARCRKCGRVGIPPE